MKYCPYCGVYLKDSAFSFCPECGNTLSETSHNSDLEDSRLLARKIQFLGNENMTSLIISRIEKNQRHVCDGELWQIATALGVTMEWLVGKEEESVE